MYIRYQISCPGEAQWTWRRRLARDQMNRYFDIYSRSMRYTVTI